MKDNETRDIEFLSDEVRNGFYIPTAIKQAWMAELKVLKEIDRICKKHKIKYFANWGTLLGAVRHGGFIPWDDDLDIGMCREDYERFKKLAVRELPKGFTIHDYEKKEDHWLFLARITNTPHINFLEEHQNHYYNFPYIACVDIFILDYLYADEDKEKERCDEIMFLLAIADMLLKDGEITSITREKLREIEIKYKVDLGNNQIIHETVVAIYRLIELQMSRVNREVAGNIGQIFPWVLKGDRGWPKEYFDNLIDLPFENTSIPVPSRYSQILSDSYGDYLKVKKNWSGHSYPFFEKQKELFQRNSGIYIKGFSFEDCPSIKERKTSENSQERNDCLNEENRNRKRIIVFVASNSQELGYIEQLLKEKSSDNNNLTYLIRIPQAIKDVYGYATFKEDEIWSMPEIYDQYEELDWLTVDLEEMRPDEIYIMNPYDGSNPCLTVPDYYYSSNLINYTDKLVFVTPDDLDEFIKESVCEWYNTKHYVIAPALYYCDEIVVNSEKMKKIYYDRLIEEGKTGENICEKIRVHVKSDAKNSKNKSILYCIAINEIYECNGDLLEKIKKNINTILKSGLELGVCLYPIFKDYWLESGDGYLKGLLEIAGTHIIEPNDGLANMNAFMKEIVAKFDAYYGSPSPLVAVFANNNKPVMISNYYIT